jgi:hypothetical protein
MDSSKRETVSGPRRITRLTIDRARWGVGGQKKRAIVRLASRLNRCGSR